MFGEYTPLMKSGLLDRRLKRRNAVIDPFLGLQKWCPNCQEYWPQDTLFWFPSSREADGLQCWCKACQLDYKKEKLYE